MNECYKVVRIREREFWSLSPVDVFVGILSEDGTWRVGGGKQRLGGNLIYRVDQRTDAFEDSLGIFVFSTKWDYTEQIERWYHCRPVAILSCECGDLEEQDWRIDPEEGFGIELYRFTNLSRWMELRVTMSQHLHHIPYFRSHLSEPVNTTPTGSLTTPWVIPRKVLGRIGS